MKPLILDYAINRIGEFKVIYTYDSKQSLNTVCINNVQTPFINIDTGEVSLLTKTKVRQESDDDNLSSELLTKTRVDREKDDDPCTLLELQTKTFTQRERDDEDPSYLQ
jgi:hypothetical protein